MKTNGKILATALGCALATQAASFEVENAQVLRVSDETSTTIMDATVVELGDLELRSAFSRATLPNQPVAGAFLTISNTGTEDDVLIAVTTSVAGRSEIHVMAMSGDTMKMRELPNGLPIPADETVELVPGGYDLMFFDLAGPFVEGERFEADLEFERAGTVTVSFIIEGKGAKRTERKGHGS